VEYFELLFVRLLHTLAHHPDFSTGREDLLDLAKCVAVPFPLTLDVECVYRYIQFYLDLVATQENVALLYHLASKGKTVRDHVSFTHSEVGPFLTGSLVCGRLIMFLHIELLYAL